MKSNVSNLDSLLLSQDSSQIIPSINLKCRDAKLFEQFFFSSITSVERSLIIDELHRRDPLLLNELFNKRSQALSNNKPSVYETSFTI